MEPRRYPEATRGSCVVEDGGVRTSGAERMRGGGWRGRKRKRRRARACGETARRCAGAQMAISPCRLIPPLRGSIFTSISVSIHLYR